MKRIIGLSSVLSMLSLVFVSCSSIAERQSEEDRAIYPFCFEISDSAKRPLVEQGALVKKLGFNGVGYPLWLDDNLGKNLKTIDDAGLKVYMLYTTLNVNPAAKQAFNPKLKDAISSLKGRPVTICVLLQGLPPADSKGDETALKVLREMGDIAAGAGLRISIYHHKNDWTESLLFALKVAEKVNHPNVGVNFNLCHWLMVDGAKDYRAVLRQNSAKIFMVTINGAKLGSKTWTNGLIQPLDQGDFDNGELLKVLREIKYRGPIGLMCYGIPGDAGEHLARSMETWNKLKVN